MSRLFRLVFWETLFLSTALVSCREVSTIDAREAYYFWAHENPQPKVSVLHGQYWRSGHFTLEYILFLKLQVPGGWMTKFAQQNDLVLTAPVTIPASEAPDWFRPNKNSVYYQSVSLNQGSYYCYDSSENSVWIYEIQL